MTGTVSRGGATATARAGSASIRAGTAAAMTADEAVVRLGTRRTGLTADEAAGRLAANGPNAVPRGSVHLTTILLAQLRSPLLGLLFGTALLSAVVGEHTNALILLTILAAGTGLGVVNDYRSERAARALDAVERRRAGTLRDNSWTTVEVTALVVGDVVRITAGSIVPADLRLIEVDDLSCDESVLTGEAFPVVKSTDPIVRPAALPELSSCAFSGTIVRGGHGIGVVVGTGAATEFGRIQRGLQHHQPATAFETGLRHFSGLLATIAVIVSSAVFVINLLLGRGVLDALLFAAAIAVGITPQLLPAVVSSSLAHGSRELARQKVLVKRLVAIEDLGDLTVLVTDKTGTLTTGEFRLTAAVGPDNAPSDSVRDLALLASELEIGDDARPVGDPLDIALWDAVPDAAERTARTRRLALVPFDHERRRVTVLVRRDDGSTTIVTKGAPESVLDICAAVTETDRDTVQKNLASGARVIAVATRDGAPAPTLTVADEHDLRFAGLLVFDDPPKPGAAEALHRLDDLDVRVLIASGDSAAAAARLATSVLITASGDEPLTGPDIDRLDDRALAEHALGTRVLARVGPEQKERLVRALRRHGHAVGFLGDGVNDALALHAADVGLSVDTAADVAREAADVVLLEKSLDVVADGITEGRRIFANTIKYVLMGTSSNFGNILSASAASALLDFLPMLPSQLLLNNLLYDSGQLAIPSDRVDAEQLRRPGQWNLAVIRRFMLLFGPLSSVFDFVMFGVLLGPFHAHADLFRTGWFVESLATQSLVVFVIRTRRVPFVRSRPGTALLAGTLAVVVIGALLPLSPLADDLGFTAPGALLYLAIAALATVYLLLVDTAKRAVFDGIARRPRTGVPTR